jgi:hypothetical protein
MNEYIIYTTEGKTIAPIEEEKDIENCQVLGRVKAQNKSKALQVLINENPWITDAGYSSSCFIIEQILTEEQRKDIQMIVDYLYENEEQHYKDYVCPNKHILLYIKALKDILT